MLIILVDILVDNVVSLWFQVNSALGLMRNSSQLRNLQIVRRGTKSSILATTRMGWRPLATAERPGELAESEDNSVTSCLDI